MPRAWRAGPVRSREHGCPSTEFGRNVADRRFKRGLGHPHHVVVLHDHLAAVIGHREHRAAVLHQRLGEMRHPHERPAGDIHRLQETVAPDIHNAAVQRLLRRKCNRMQQEIELPPLACNPLEHLFGLAFHHDVQRHEDRRFQRMRERFDMLLGTVIEVGDGELRPEGAKRPCAAPGDGLVVGDADDEAFYPSGQPWYPGTRGS